MLDYQTTPPPPDFDSTPASPGVPHSREAEEAVIGAVLINPEIYWEIVQIVKPDDFYLHRNKWIFEAYAELASSGTPIDLLTVSDMLAKMDTLKEVGGSAYLTGLINQVPSSLNAGAYAGIVKDMSERRKGITFANKLASACYSPDPFDLREQAIRIVQSNGNHSRRVDAKQAASRAIDQMISNPKYCKFGISNQDRDAGGFFADELNILAGYPGTGKTALEIHSARANADEGKRVLVASLEMSASQMWMRMACGDLELDMNQVRKGLVTAETRSALVHHAAQLAEMYQDLIVIYESPMTPMDILSATMLEQPDIVYVDHLGLLEGKPAGDNRMDWYNFCTRFLRQNVAKGDNHIPVVLLHQLSRSASKEKRRPTKQDLAYAGDQDSDGIFLLHNPDDEAKGRTIDLEIITAKSRFGWTGIQTVRFHRVKQRFAPPTPAGMVES